MDEKINNFDRLLWQTNTHLMREIETRFEAAGIRFMSIR